MDGRLGVIVAPCVFSFKACEHPQAIIFLPLFSVVWPQLCGSSIDENVQYSRRRDSKRSCFDVLVFVARSYAQRR
jgi:hypothetical protein